MCGSHALSTLISQEKTGVFYLKAHNLSGAEPGAEYSLISKLVLFLCPSDCRVAQAGREGDWGGLVCSPGWDRRGSRSHLLQPKMPWLQGIRGLL